MEIREHTGANTLPFVVEEVPGARHLLVVFPQSVPNAPPHLEMRRYIDHFNAHRVYLGTDETLYMGPDRKRVGAFTAAEIIRLVADELGVDSGDIVAFGTSFRAVCSMYIGLLAGVGHILVAGPPVHFAGHVAGLDRVLIPETDVMARRNRLADILGVDRYEDAVEFYDALIPRAAAEARHPVRLDMLSSPDDATHVDVLWFAEQLADHPTIDVTATIEDYGGHADSGPAFYARLDQLLLPLTGRRPEPEPDVTAAR